MEDELLKWVHSAIEQCMGARKNGVAVMFRNDDYNAIVSSETEPSAIRELGVALACGYGEED